MIEVRNLSVRLGNFRLEGVNFDIPQGAYAVLMGRTGSGKTTIQECICGLRPTLSGSISLAGRDVTHLPPAERDVGYVPQDAALFPTMNIYDHLAFALQIRRWTRAQCDARVKELAELLGIEHLLARRPKGLSGGEAQRVALGRALSFHPAILLLDEPLSALDDETRQQMHSMLRKVKERTRVTTLHITHSRDDARQLADCVFVMSGGQVRAEWELEKTPPLETIQE